MNVPAPVEHGIPWGGAGKRVCVDFDGTIFPWGPVADEDTPPFEGAVEVIKKLKDEGFTIFIFTSRMSPLWWSEMGWSYTDALSEQHAFVTTRLRKWGIPYDVISSEKVPARYYIDDRAIGFRGDWADVKATIEADLSL
jgi:hypothetical protein